MNKHHSTIESSHLDVKDQLETQIRDAFSFHSQCEFEIGDQTASYLEDLTLFDTATQKQIVPYLMILILRMGITNVPDGEQLLFFLDGAELKRDKSGELRSRNSRSQAEVQYIEATLSSYSTAQINSIIEWLKFISRGPLWGFLPDVVDSCLFYWSLKKSKRG